MNTEPVGSRSSETWSHPIEVNNSNKAHASFTPCLYYWTRPNLRRIMFTAETSKKLNCRGFSVNKERVGIKGVSSSQVGDNEAAKFFSCSASLFSLSLVLQIDESQFTLPYVFPLTCKLAAMTKLIGLYLQLLLVHCTAHVCSFVTVLLSLFRLLCLKYAYDC
jgi:hypothetical protein